MNLSDYQREAQKFAQYPLSNARPYLFEGLLLEALELAEISTAYSLMKECGDVLWFVSMLATYLNLDLTSLATSPSITGDLRYLQAQTLKYAARVLQSHTKSLRGDYLVSVETR